MIHALDVRWPIGALWVLIGALLLGYGLASGAGGPQSLAVDRWWGAAMLAFGVAMLALAARGRARGGSGGDDDGRSSDMVGGDDDEPPKH